MTTTTRTNSRPTLDALGDAPTGGWVIDPLHSSVSFAVRHLMSKVRGRFTDLEGRIEVGDSIGGCTVEASAATASVDTGVGMRDDDLRSERFLAADTHPRVSFTSTSVTGRDGRTERISAPSSATQCAGAVPPVSPICLRRAGGVRSRVRIRTALRPAIPEGGPARLL